MSFFTIGIPTYNRAHLLPYTLSCLLRQTFPDFEVVISDNASSDDTAKVVAKFQDPRLRYVRQSTNLGLFKNFAACVDQARGDWFLFNTDDDLLCPFFLERCARAVQKFPQVVMYATECTMSEDVRSVFGTRMENLPLRHGWDQEQPRLIPGLQIAALSFFRTGFFPPAQAFPTPLIREHIPRGPDDHLLADRYITWRIACEGPVAYESYNGALLSDHPGRFSHHHIELGRQTAIHNAQVFLDFCEKRNLDWQNALREIVPELPRSFCEMCVQRIFFDHHIPQEVFEIMATELAAEKNMSPHQYIAFLKAQSRGGRLDRLKLPRPVVRIFRKVLSMMGKNY